MQSALLAAERARKREDLLAATERELANIATAIQRGRAGPCAELPRLGLRVGACAGPL